MSVTTVRQVAENNFRLTVQGRDGTRRLPSERDARSEMRRQIARLEQQLATRFGDAFSRTQINVNVPAAGDPRLLSMGELEVIRDALVARIADSDAILNAQSVSENQTRALLERMLKDPAQFKWVRISRSDIGEPGCGHWHSRPRFGLLGMMMNWWRVKISSGCP